MKSDVYKNHIFWKIRHNIFEHNQQNEKPCTTLYARHLPVQFQHPAVLRYGSIELTINVTDEQRHFNTRLSLKTLPHGCRVGEDMRTDRLVAFVRVGELTGGSRW